VLKKKASAAAGNGITTAAKVSAAIPVRAFKGMDDWSVTRAILGVVNVKIAHWNVP
jgi:hypothetical protein